jgi:four helix bundle protein
VVKAYKYPVDEKKEFVISKQFLRSGTSIGANAEEAVGGQSRADFIAKSALPTKKPEKPNTGSDWLQATNYLDESQTAGLLNDLDELLKIIGKIQITSKKN